MLKNSATVATASRARARNRTRAIPQPAARTAHLGMTTLRLWVRRRRARRTRCSDGARPAAPLYSIPHLIVAALHPAHGGGPRVPPYAAIRPVDGIVRLLISHTCCLVGRLPFHLGCLARAAPGRSQHDDLDRAGHPRLLLLLRCGDFYIRGRGLL